MLRVATGYSVASSINQVTYNWQMTKLVVCPSAEWEYCLSDLSEAEILQI